jgi:hypothetical protein
MWPIYLVQTTYTTTGISEPACISGIHVTTSSEDRCLLSMLLFLFFLLILSSLYHIASIICLRKHCIDFIEFFLYISSMLIPDCPT